MANPIEPHNFDFQELFDLKKVQMLQDSFATATGVASIITDIYGTPITRPSNFCTLCNIIRKTKKGWDNCIHSNAAIGRYLSETPIVQTCPSGGLWDTGVGITANGRHIATWIAGQVRNENTDTQKILGYAKDIGADIRQFEKALDKVAVMPLEKLRNISRHLFIMARELSAQGGRKLKQKKLTMEKKSARERLRKKNIELRNAIDLLTTQIETRKKIESELRKNNEYLEALHETSIGMFSHLDLSYLLESIIVRASNLTGIPDGFITIYDSRKKKLEIKAACGKLRKLTGLKLNREEGLLGKVLVSGSPLLINDYQSWAGKSRLAQFNFVKSAMGVPLNSGSRIEGTIGLSHHDLKKKINSDTLQILEQFAELATIAIDNAKLFESLKTELDKRIQLEEERREMEIQLRQSQKMEAIGTLAGGIAHDFNNILFPIIGFSELIMSELPENSTIRDSLQLVIEGAKRAKDLVRQILTFSRQTENDYHPLQPQIILKEVLNLARASLPSTIKIINNVSNETGMVLADPTQIHQIAMNLITNALHAMEESGGVLTFDLKDVEFTEKHLPVAQMRPGHYVCLDITDTGCGMAPETIKRIWEPYFTTKQRCKGTGLGLAVVHGIVKNMRGEICVLSTPGKGTSFSVYLPKFMGTQEVNNTQTISGNSLKGDEKILLVDDEKAILDMITLMLKRSGYDVKAYDTSTIALSAFQSSPYGYDIVITDLTMPGLTGTELLNQIKEIRPEIPVILFTGFGKTIVNKRTRGAKPDKILIKPSGKDEILKSIRMLLDE